MLTNGKRQKEMVDQPPYVVSSDLAAIFCEWGEACNILVPDPGYFSDRVKDIVGVLGTIFSDVRIPDNHSITSLFRQVSEEATSPILSIDKIYMSSVLDQGFSGYLSITRAVDPEMNAVGLVSRPVSWDAENVPLYSLENAVSKIAQEYRQKNITLVDDVIFSGGTISQIVDVLQEHEIEVNSVVAGISIGEAKEKLASRGIQLRSAHHYPDVIDEICCRDFIIGSPYGGRTVIASYQVNGAEGTLSSIQYAPYILSLGNPVKWATIPKERVRDFSICMMDISTKIWSDIQDLNHRYFSTSDLGCRVYRLPERPSVVDAIQDVRGRLSP